MKADKLFWGLIFVFVGTIFLLENFDIIDFSWRYIWHFWPLLLIITGVNIVFANSKSKSGAIIIGVITLLALSFLTFKGLEQRTSESRRWSWNWDSDEDEEETDKDSSNFSTYSEDYSSNYKEATLNVYGAASTFEIETGADKLFESEIKETSNRYFLKKTETDSSVVLEFRTKNENTNFNFKNDEYSKVRMKINDNPIWDINLKMGAGKIDFDFSKNKVKNVSLKGGAAEFNVKLGDLYNDVDLTAETGVAEIKIAIPKNSGCKIKTQTGLSSKDFQGFTKNSDGTYETENFKTSPNKINILLKGGLSDFEVTRY
jgi:hypothetical protein